MTAQSRTPKFATMALVLAAGGMTAGGSSATTQAETFTQVHARDGAVVKVQVGASSQSVRIEGDEVHASRLRTRIEGGVLTVGPRRSWAGLFTSTSVYNATVIVTVETLNDVRASNGAQVEARGFGVQAVNAAATNGAILKLSGGCSTLEARAARGAIIEAGGLLCEAVSARASMGGEVEASASASKAMSASMGGIVDISGAGTVVTSRSSMGGDIDG